MSDSLPVAAGVTHPGAPPPKIALDPALLTELAAQLQERAAQIRASAPALVSAWQQAAGALSAQQTGAVLAASSPSCAAALGEFASSVESLASAVRAGAVRYAAAEATAVPALR